VWGKLAVKPGSSLKVIPNYVHDEVSAGTGKNLESAVPPRPTVNTFGTI
jgi:hypothetical protein